MKVYKRFISGLLAILAVTATTLGFSSVRASAAEDDGKAKTHIEVTLSPVKTDMELEPGKTYTGEFLMMNDSTMALKYEVFATPYQMTGDNFDEVSYSLVNRFTQMTDWIKFITPNGTAKAGEQKKIKYRITVPDNAPGDSQFVSLMVKTTATDTEIDGSGVVPSYQVGTLLYAKVAGENNECGKIINNTTNTFLFEPKISASATVENCGNIYTDVKHTLQVFPLFSNEEVYTNEEDPEQAIALPETKRFVTSSWDNAPAFGLFTVKHTVSIFGETSVINKVVLICPIWLLIIFIALFIAIIFWAASNRRQRKADKANRLATSGVKTEKDKKD